MMKSIGGIGMRYHDFWEGGEVSSNKRPVMITHHWEKNILAVADITNPANVFM
jgi:hypothetical protein